MEKKLAWIWLLYLGREGGGEHELWRKNWHGFGFFILGEKEVGNMNYRRLCYLKFKGGYSTQELMERYPCEIGRITKIALLDLDEKVLVQILHQKKLLKFLMLLRKKFVEKLCDLSDNARSKR